MNDTGLFKKTIASNAAAGDGNEAAAGMRRRRRPTLREADRLTDALRVTRAVLQRLASQDQSDAADTEALRSAIETADAVLGGRA